MSAYAVAHGILGKFWCYHQGNAGSSPLYFVNSNSGVLAVKVRCNGTSIDSTEGLAISLQIWEDWHQQNVYLLSFASLHSLMFAAYRARRGRTRLAAHFRGVLSGDENSLPRFVLSIADFSITVFYKWRVFDQ